MQTKRGSKRARESCTTDTSTPVSMRIGLIKATRPFFGLIFRPKSRGEVSFFFSAVRTNAHRRRSGTSRAILPRYRSASSFSSRIRRRDLPHESFDQLQCCTSFESARLRLAWTFETRRSIDFNRDRTTNTHGNRTGSRMANSSQQFFGSRQASACRRGG